LSNAEVKNAWSYASTALYVFMTWCLVKHQEKLHLFLTYVVCGILMNNEVFSADESHQYAGVKLTLLLGGLFGCETWHVAEKIKIAALENKFLRTVLGRRRGKA
jgi:hypothetical protein